MTKKLVFEITATIEVELGIGELSEVDNILENLKSMGSAEIVNVTVEEVKND